VRHLVRWDHGWLINAEEDDADRNPCQRPGLLGICQHPVHRLRADQPRQPYCRILRDRQQQIPVSGSATSKAPREGPG
jgi:hypothetical protein